jgi:hypothetical protein
MAPKSLPHNQSAVLRSHTESAATLHLMRNTLAGLQATTEQTRAVIDETRIAIAEADALLGSADLVHHGRSLDA